MSKTFDSACFPADRNSTARLGWCSLCLAALLLAPAALHAQTIRSWEDEFLNRRKIDSLQNADIDTVQGFITLTPNRETSTQGQQFRAVLSGIDNTFFEPHEISGSPLNPPITIVDIDTVPGEPEVYLITDFQNRVVMGYNAATSQPVSVNLISGKNVQTPQDAFPFRERGTLKVLITDSQTRRVLKVNANNGNLEWSYQNGLLNPRDAVMLPRSSEVLICDSGNDRIVTVDTTTDAITWQFGDRSIFRNPVDVDFDPTSALNVDVYLVTDQDNHRVILVRRDNSQITFQFGKTGVSGNTDSTLTSPIDADPLPNGNILIADQGNSRLIEVNRQGQVVWRIARDLFDLRDADRIGSGPHFDKTLVALRDSASATNVTAKRLAYKDEYFLSPAKDFGRPVDFDSLRFTANTPEGTSVGLQLRTVLDLSDTTNTPWFGPNSSSDYYTTSPAAINMIHDGSRFYQFRALLQTQNRLKTPELTQVDVKATFFRTDTLGRALSQVVQDSANSIITAWRRLEFDTNLGLAGSIDVDIMNATGDTVLTSKPALSSTTSPYDIGPDNERALRGRQALRLRANLRTTGASTSPKLLRWKLEWNSVKLGPSQTSFLNASGTKVDKYRVSTTPGDSIYARVDDANVLPLSDSVRVEVRSSGGDVEHMTLAIDRASLAFFRSGAGLRLVLSNQPTSGNRLLEVSDRDSLRVTYVDPFDATDRSSAAALVIQNTRGTIQIEFSNGVVRDSVSTTDLIYIRVLGENDRNLSSVLKDTILVDLTDPQSGDAERIILEELEDQSNHFNTGTFRTPIGVSLVSTGSPDGDGRLWVIGGSTMQASFTDPDARPDELPIQTFVPVIRGDESIIINSTDKFVLQIAPNPYRAQSTGPIKLRAEVRSGSMGMRQVEIFNLAGEKVTTIPEGSIRFGASSILESSQGPVVSFDWWNLQGDDGRPVATGTYFAKFHLTLTDAQGAVNQITDLKKILILQQ